MSLVLVVLLVVQQSRHSQIIATLQVELRDGKVAPRQRQPMDSNDDIPATKSRMGKVESKSFAELDAQFALIALRQKLVKNQAGKEPADSEPEVVTDVFDPQQSYRFEIMKQLKSEILKTEK